MSADADCHLSSDRSTPATEFPGIPLMTVHCRIAFVCSAHVIAKNLDRISATLQKAGASEVSIAVSKSPEAFSPTGAGHSSANWMAAPKGAADD